jgi:hypothetical protein
MIYPPGIKTIVIALCLPRRLEGGVTFAPIDLGPHPTINLIFFAAAIFGDGSFMRYFSHPTLCGMSRLRRNVTALG